uniref:AlNc14C2G237 protein n=1 Tax=Albugo laibachii Nc14 TaxID=890382 RepID=F0VZ96_9STRA|nr:AlNc14C2G237 [Albugo laibachii Nc14]|eukprot:CCA14126.1 AlNc14C2G237 [Albugo laibachii Nc14]
MANPWRHSTGSCDTIALGGLQDFVARHRLVPTNSSISKDSLNAQKSRNYEKSSLLKTLTQLQQLSDLHQTVLERTKQVERMEAAFGAADILTPQRIEHRISVIRSCRVQMERFVSAADSILQILRSASMEDAIPIELQHQKEFVEVIRHMTQYSKYSPLENLSISEQSDAKMAQFLRLAEKLQESVQNFQSTFERLKNTEKTYKSVITESIN